MYTIHLSAQTNVPEKERYIFLWDVSKSLLPEEGGIDKYTEQLLDGYPGSNGLWMDLKEGLIKAINSLKTNEHSEIIVIPFYAEPFEPFIAKADSLGKAEIIKKVKNFKYIDARDPYSRKHRTNIISALSKFEDIVKKDCLEYINYLYLYTDGAHENNDGKTTTKEWNELKDKIVSFDKYVNFPGRYIYRFYYLVSDTADPRNVIRDLESDSRKFWVVDGLVDINHIYLETSSINYIVYDNPSKNMKKDICKTIKLKQDIKSYKGDFIFTPQNDDFYNVECTKSPNDTLIKIKVTPRDGVELPKKHKIIVNIKLDTTQKYYYLLNPQIVINCINTPERCVTLSLKNTTEEKSNGNEKRFNLGNTSYYPPCMGKSSQLNCLNFSLCTDFDKFAVSDKGCLDISFADSEGKPLTYTKFKIVVNKSDTLSTKNSYCHIESGQKQIDFTILPSENTDDYKFKGYLIVSHINNIDRVNGEAISNDILRILPWEFEHDRKLNPLLRSIYWIIIFLLLLVIAAVILYWFLWLLGAKFPRNWDINFESNINGNPTIVFDCPDNKDYRFKGRRVFTHNATIFFSRRLHYFRINKVVLSNKTKCVWSYWNGYSIYIKTNLNDLNNSIKSITFTPVKGILAKVEIKYLNRAENGEYKLNYRDCDNETNRININYINVDIFGRKHNN